MARILVSDKIADEGVEFLRTRDGFEVDFAPGLEKEELPERIAEADALIVRSGTQVTAEIIAAAERLQVIGRAGIGVDNIDVAAATERGIVVMNAPEANATTTAELAIAHILSLSRHLPQADASVRSGAWERARFVGSEVSGKTLGIVGFGTIGRIVADRAIGLKMRVVGFDPFVPAKVFEEFGVEAMDFAPLLREVDYLTLHCPMNDKTRGLVGRDQLEQMKSGARLINCARGGLVDEEALLADLQSGHLAGAALDVYETEPPKDSPLLSCQEVTFTPHLGASTREAQVAVGAKIAERIAGYLENGDMSGAINVSSIPPLELARVRPFQVLANRLGKLVGALAQSPIRKLEIGFYGRAAQVEAHPVSVSALVGLLSQQLDVPVNEVNAPYLGKQREISLVKTSSETAEDYLSLISVTGRHDKGQICITGTLLGGKQPRLVRLDDFAIEVNPEGTMLLTRHEDRPGVVGAIGTLLGEEGVNISDMHLGVSQSRDEALAVLGIGEPLSPALLEKIGKIPFVHRALQVRL